MGRASCSTPTATRCVPTKEMGHTLLCKPSLLLFWWWHRSMHITCAVVGLVQCQRGILCMIYLLVHLSPMQRWRTVFSHENLHREQRLSTTPIQKLEPSSGQTKCWFELRGLIF